MGDRGQTPAPGDRQTDPRFRLGPLLGFHPAIAALYEQDTGAERIRLLRVVIPLGLVVYNCYDATNFVIARDVFGWGVAARLLVTIVGIAILWHLPRMPARLRETIVTVAMIGSSGVPLMLFWMSREPLGPYSFSDFFLTVVFGAVLLLLRFPAAIIYILACLAMALTAVWSHPGLEDNLRLAFSLQTVSVCAFMLTSNGLLQGMQRRAFLDVYAKTLESDERERQRQRLSTLSMTDPLTGVANRRHLDEALDAAVDAARETESRLALLMIDIDHFKRYNDVHGHPAGDACLRAVAEIFSRVAFRQADALLARYGGEEFAVLMPGADEADALALAARLRSSLASEGIAPLRLGAPQVRVTASIGIAVLGPGDAASSAALVAAADAALYEAKRLGRDRAVLSDRNAGTRFDLAG